MSSDQARPQRDQVGPVVSFATRAYRADLASRTQPLGDHDSEWLAIAALLEHAAQLPESEAAAVLQHVEHLAAEIASPAALEALVTREWQNTEIHRVDAIVAVAEEAQDRNAFHLAVHMLDALLAANRSLSELQRGRILARRARAAFKVGDVDGAADGYAQVLRIGRALHNPDLRARGWVGRGSVAFSHGNYPEVWRCARCAARIADRHDLRMLSHYAHNWLMVAAAMSGRIDDALAHGWRSYRAAAGAPLKEAEVLVNVSQTLFDTGHVREARAGWTAVIATNHLTAHIALPALGGMAMASALLDDPPRLLWAAREVARLDRAGAPRHSVAAALLECAIAFARIGESAAAAQYAAAALQLARAHGFHEIAFKAESLEVSAPSPAMPRVRLSAQGAAVARDVERLGSDGLPKHVALSTVGDE